ncbi:hypothetical protein BT67DRAFT_437875 [Trichocladium antarcticum]|uniref:Apple domain-containing protein n=1 Tax=Trichocladium antarcticum TaxID=1450529 RepID=A0AAN6UTC1_9PEZI|nr:hypothetical protein BT67DRAFT_437875 [Trichocladium antarcticum]
MAVIGKFASLLLWAAFALMAIAAPARDGTLTEISHHRFGATATRAVMASTCTDGMSAARQNPSSYPINDYTVVTPDEDWPSYMIKHEWYGEHFVSGPHYMAFTHESDPFGPFKCQYTCNAADNCNSYFAWYENVGTNDEHFNCVLFDAVTPQSVFVETHGTIATGAYNKICDHPEPSA